MDSYQAVYDAVRSRISYADVGAAVREAASQAFDISHAVAMIRDGLQHVAYEQQRPSVLYRPTLTQDGNAWLAIYGDLPTGVVGCGSTPEQAMADFDKAWHRTLPAPPSKES